MVATTDPEHLPELTTWYLTTNLPAPQSTPSAASALAEADVAEIVRLYALRIWVEQSYKQVKGTLGWTEYQVRSAVAIRRHWTLVWCAFSFCWWHASHTEHPEVEWTDPLPETDQEVPTAMTPGGGKKSGHVRPSAAHDVAADTPGRPRVVGTLDAAVALLARVVTPATPAGTTGTPGVATGRSGALPV